MTKRTCVDLALISEYLSGVLQDDAAETFEGHLPECESCTALLKRLIDQTAEPDWLTMARQMAAASEDAEVIPGDSCRATVPAARRYVRKRVVGSGGMGVVWEGWDNLMSRSVALKQLRAKNADVHGVQRLLQEASVLSRLSHQHIVSVYDLVTDEAEPIIVMEYVEGLTLAAWQQGLPVAPRAAAEVVMAVAAALQHAHKENVVHRDIKPSNVLMKTYVHRVLPRDESGQLLVKLSDFGLARIAGDPGLTLTGQAPGTPSYMAPEQIISNGIANVSTDVYSLGVLLYELLTGNPPVRSSNPSLVLITIEKQDPIAPHLINSDIPRDLETICLKCLCRNPADRYGSVEMLNRDLRAFLDGRPILARPLGTFRRLLRWRQRNRLVAALLTSTLVTLLIAIVSARMTIHRTQQLLTNSTASERQAKAAAAAEKKLRERAEAAEHQASSTAIREQSLRRLIQDLLYKVVAYVDVSIRSKANNGSPLMTDLERTELNASFLANKVIQEYINTLDDSSQVLTWNDLELTLRYFSLKQMTTDVSGIEELFERVDVALKHHMQAPQDPLRYVEFVRVRQLYFDITLEYSQLQRRHIDNWITIANAFKKQFFSAVDAPTKEKFAKGHLSALNEARISLTGELGADPVSTIQFLRETMGRITEELLVPDELTTLSPDVRLRRIQLLADLAGTMISAGDIDAGTLAGRQALQELGPLIQLISTESDLQRMQDLREQLDSIPMIRPFTFPATE